MAEVETIVEEPVTVPVKQYKTPAYLLRGIKAYQDRNREKINEYARNRYKEKFDNDPEFREKERQRHRERKARKKLEEQSKNQQKIIV
jgi:hypothetical protein